MTEITDPILRQYLMRCLAVAAAAFGIGVYGFIAGGPVLTLAVSLATSIGWLVMLVLGLYRDRLRARWILLGTPLALFFPLLLTLLAGVWS